jgi:hypothetical protein
MPVPPDNFSPPQLALWWLKQGGLEMGAQWERAHTICQTAEGTLDYDLVHALAHWIEGDIGNRDYWYRRAGVVDCASTIALEWDRLWAKLSSA